MHKTGNLVSLVIWRVLSLLLIISGLVLLPPKRSSKWSKGMETKSNGCINKTVSLCCTAHETDPRTVSTTVPLEPALGRLPQGVLGCRSKIARGSRLFAASSYSCNALLSRGILLGLPNTNMNVDVLFFCI